MRTRVLAMLAALLLALPGCRSLEVKAVTFAVNLNVTVPPPGR